MLCFSTVVVDVFLWLQCVLVLYIKYTLYSNQTCLAVVWQSVIQLLMPLDFWKMFFSKLSKGNALILLTGWRRCSRWWCAWTLWNVAQKFVQLVKAVHVDDSVLMLAIDGKQFRVVCLSSNSNRNDFYLLFLQNKSTTWYYTIFYINHKSEISQSKEKLNFTSLK